MRIVATAAAMIGASFFAAAVGGCDADDEGESEFSERLLEIAAEYQEYEPVDGTHNWAPLDCAAPIPVPLPHLSESDHEQSHGRKLYYLFAAKGKPYLDAPQKENPVGQALVKQSWTAELFAAELLTPGTPDGSAGNASSVPIFLFAEHDGKKYLPGEQRALFIMFKTDPETPGTDNGWVYGTVTADGQKVTSVGRIESCMECHGEAGDDRLFGPQ